MSCGVPDCSAPARPYPEGWRCAAHSPLGRLGLPDHPPGPGWPRIPPRAPSSYTALNDQRAIASGKRRSTPAAYRQARTQLAQRHGGNAR
jgi:hypothetical protein